MMTERRSDFVLKSGYMVKRSQNKKRFTPVNYKTRWFELTRFYLSYYDIGNLEMKPPLAGEAQSTRTDSVGAVNKPD
uniref:PH domain-containing protein n=1 Tax=Anopheles albimanus TaxID=7167 RepID=A0A182F1F9_ANOAL